MSPRLIIFIVAALLLFTVFVTVLAASANKNEVRNLPKWLWVLLCLVPIIGGLLYLVLGRPLGGPRTRGGKSRVIAPDDDPAFLRDLSSKLESKDEAPEAEKPKEQDPDSDSKDKS
jgi:hypothetical protein